MDLLDLIPARPGSDYPPHRIAEAITHYAASGNVVASSKALKIPERTLYEWRTYDWWDTALAEVRRSKQDELDAALTGLIHSAVAAAHDRIVSGDHRLVKRKTEEGETCELVRIPVSARDCAIVAAISADKRQIVRGQATEIIEHSSDKLTQLREQLRQLSGRTIEGAVVQKLESNQEVGGAGADV